MTPRNTNTGGVLEAMILPALERGGYTSAKQAKIGTRCGGGTHKVDAIARKGDATILVSLKWQQTGGTAEQKVPFEVMCLADAIRAGHAQHAYLVLGGDGWSLRDYYTSGALREHLAHAALVNVVTLEAFIRLANNGQPPRRPTPRTFSLKLICRDRNGSRIATLNSRASRDRSVPRSGSERRGVPMADS